MTEQCERLYCIDTPEMWITESLRPQWCNFRSQSRDIRHTESIPDGMQLEKKGNVMDYTLNADGHRGNALDRAWEAAQTWRNAMRIPDANMRKRLEVLLENPEQGAVTAEYAVVLIAATGFAALLVVILKSDAIREVLDDLVKQALNVG